MAYEIIFMLKYTGIALEKGDVKPTNFCAEAAHASLVIIL